jgi:hypothetical protein
MGQFLGYVALEANLAADKLTVDSSRLPKEPSALPTFRIYGPAGLMSNGSGSASKLDTGSVTGATNASPIVIASTGHGLNSGTRLTLSNVGGNTAANGDWQITKIDNDHFSLDGSTGNGSYTSGGSWHVTGLHAVTPAIHAADGYISGQTYFVLTTWVISGTTYGDIDSFIVA